VSVICECRGGSGNEKLRLRVADFRQVEVGRSDHERPGDRTFHLRPWHARPTAIIGAIEVDSPSLPQAAMHMLRTPMTANAVSFDTAKPEVDGG